MAENFIYNPAEKIAGSFDQANASLGNAFATVLARKQHDYDVADHIFQNLEALKKDVNLFGREDVKKMVSETMGEMASNISESGNLDYAKLGLVRNKISEIKDRKEYWETFADLREEKFKQLINDKDLLKSFASSVKSIDALAFDKTIRTAKDLATRFDETVIESYAPALSLKKGLEVGVRPEQTVDGYYKDPKGYTIGYQGKLPAGMGYDPVTKKFSEPTDPDWAKKDVAALNAQSPEIMKILKKNISGVAGAFNTDEDIYKHFLYKTFDKPEEKVIGQPKVWKPTKGGGSPKNTTFGSQDIYETKVPEAGGNVKVMPTGKPIKIAVQPGQEGIISSVGRNAKGEIWVETYYKTDGSLWTDETDLAGAKTGFTKVEIPETEFINKLKSVAANAYKDPFGNEFIKAVNKIKKASGNYVGYIPPADDVAVGYTTSKKTGERKQVTRKMIDQYARKLLKEGKISDLPSYIGRYSKYIKTNPTID